MTSLRITIDDELCAGHGRCYSLHPELFEADDRGYPIVRQVAVSVEGTPGARDAVEACPESAITLSSSSEGT
jgi:ferredoxin